MRVGIDARMAQWTGVGRYITGLCSAVFSVDPSIEYRLLLNPDDPEDAFPAAPNARIVRCRRHLKPYSAAEQLHLPKELRALEADLLHLPHFNVPRLGRLPFVTTIHDLIYFLFPEDAPSKLALWVAKRLIRSAVRRARAVLTVSENTRRDLLRLLHVPAERIHVTPLGPPVFEPKPDKAPAARQAFGLQGDYILYTGNHSPHKNLKTLLDAFASLVRDGAPLQLVITGSIDRHTPSVRRHVAALRLQENVVFTGKVADDLLAGLYAGANALGFPSLYEGFGIPPLEAFAAGVPVVASNAASIPDVVGDAALLVDPNDAEGIRKALARLLSEEGLREKLVRAGRERLARFSWETTARRTIEVYRAVV